MSEIANLNIFNSITPVNDVTAKTEAAQGLLMHNSKASTIGPSVLAGIDMELVYTVNGVEANEPYKIEENEFFYKADSDPNTDTVKLCLESKNGYKAKKCSVSLDSIEKHYNKFMGIVIKDIFKGAFPMPKFEDIKVQVKAKVDGEMQSAFEEGLIQSPLFCVLASAIDMIQ